MIPTIITGVVVAGYAAFILYRGIKHVKNGKMCGCGCANCRKGCDLEGNTDNCKSKEDML